MGLAIDPSSGRSQTGLLPQKRSRAFGKPTMRCLWKTHSPHAWRSSCKTTQR